VGCKIQIQLRNQVQKSKSKAARSTLVASSRPLRSRSPGQKPNQNRDHNLLGHHDRWNADVS
jgi:hypothetical protein